MHRKETDIGELIALFFEHFLSLYGDEELATVATAAAINDLLTTGSGCPEGSAAA